MFEIAKNFISSKELLWNLVVKELKVRYKNSVLGFLWALLNPLLMMIVFTLVFSVLMKGAIRIEKYPLFLLCGYLPWIFFNNSISESTTSITLNGNLINKVYFPRELLPISKVLSNLVNYILGLSVFIPFLFFFNIHFEWNMLYIPLIIILHIFFATGLGLFFSCVNVFFRDVSNLIEILMLTWMFLTPLWYPVELVILMAPQYLILYLLNPMASFVVLYRYILFDPSAVYLFPFVGYAITIVLIATFLVFFGGYFLFKKLENDFAKEL